MKLHHKFAGALLIGSLIAAPGTLLAADQLQTRDRLHTQDQAAAQRQTRDRLHTQDRATTPKMDRAQKRNRAHK